MKMYTVVYFFPDTVYIATTYEVVTTLHLTLLNAVVKVRRPVGLSFFSGLALSPML